MGKFVCRFSQHCINIALKAWIFILEGIVTIMAGILSFWMITDFPDTAKFITEPERRSIVKSLEEDGQFSVKGESFKLKYVWQSFRDKKTYLCSEYSMFFLLDSTYFLQQFSVFGRGIVSVRSTSPINEDCSLIAVTVRFMPFRFLRRVLSTKYATIMPRNISPSKNHTSSGSRQQPPTCSASRYTHLQAY